MDNTDQINEIPETQDETPEPTAEMPSAQENTARSSDQEVIVISRVVFNYAVIAIAFLIVGVAVGWIAFANKGGAVDQQVIKDAVLLALDEYQQNTQQEGLSTDKQYTVDTTGDPATGASPDTALVTIVEFSDFRCPYCGRFATTILPEIMRNYGDRVRFVYRDFPIFGDLSIKAAVAAECAHDQGQFWSYHNLLFANAQTLSDDAFVAFAQQLDLNMDQFNNCVSSNQFLDEVQADYKDGTGFGITGTPTFFINGKPMVGAQPYENFAQAIDNAIAEAQTS